PPPLDASDLVLAAASLPPGRHMGGPGLCDTGTWAAAPRALGRRGHGGTRGAGPPSREGGPGRVGFRGRGRPLQLLPGAGIRGSGGPCRRSAAGHDVAAPLRVALWRARPLVGTPSDRQTRTVPISPVPGGDVATGALPARCVADAPLPDPRCLAPAETAC